MYILGISCFYHDSAATLIKSGKIICASQEERFTRIKNDQSFPQQSIEFCLDFANITLDDVDHVVFYDKPFLKFERIMETYLSYAPRGLRSFLKSMPIWLKEKLFTKTLIKKKLKALDRGTLKSLLFTEHHQSHAASAFYPSPFQEAMILCLDGVGEWKTTTSWKGKRNKLEPLQSIDFPHSLGLLYSAFTYYCGFKVNNGEYKLMGLAPYGEPKYIQTIEENLIDIKHDGSFHLNMDYFNYCHGLTMTNEKFHQLFGAPPRQPESDMPQIYKDVAQSIQKVFEKVIGLMVSHLHKSYGGENLCLAGGVALNCVANGKILKEGPYKNIWIQPAAGDAGGSLGAALACWYQFLNNERNQQQDAMEASLLGPEYTIEEFDRFITEKNIKNNPALQLLDFSREQLLDEVTKELEQEKVIGVFQGRTEFGPRALGNRSIIADPRSPHMQKTLNLKIKKRESFRPFAPIVIKEEAETYFDLAVESPYMLLVGQTKVDNLPSITHVDGSARVQTISRDDKRFMAQLLNRFHQKTGSPVLINTSFNVRGEPIVNSPWDAFQCFLNTEMDSLLLGPYLIRKVQS